MGDWEGVRTEGGSTSAGWGRSRKAGSGDGWLLGMTSCHANCLWVYVCLTVGHEDSTSGAGKSR